MVALRGEACSGLPVPSAADITLGLVAGGAGSRLGGLDKAWLSRDGQPQVLRLASLFASTTATVLVASSRSPGRYADAGLRTVADAVPGQGPAAGLDALARGCDTPWLLTLPVDLRTPPADLLARLVAAGAPGAGAEDDDGPQPLVALWPVAALRVAAADALATRRLAVRALHASLGLHVVRFDGRFGNLNTPVDLADAGIVPP